MVPPTPARDEGHGRPAANILRGQTQAAFLTEVTTLGPHRDLRTTCASCVLLEQSLLRRKDDLAERMAGRLSEDLKGPRSGAGICRQSAPAWSLEKAATGYRAPGRPQG